MAASGSRTLTLKLLADINAFTSGLDKGKKDVDSFSTQITNFSKKAALAFAAVGAAVLGFSKQAVEAAAQDEQAQIKLAATIEATTNASRKQIDAVEDWITKTSISIGITDDELRPAFARLVRSLKDVELAQNLLNLALDISSATGKPLESVANALGKAYDGNTTALGRLGLGLDAGLIKSKDFNAIFRELDRTFGTFAEDTAGTTQKSLDRVRIALDEANESIGTALLPVVQDLTAWILDHFVPALQATIGGLTGDESVKSALGETYQEFYRWGERIRSVIKTVVSLKEEILIVAGVMATMFVASKIAAGIAATISTINLLIKAYNALKASAFVAGVAAYFALNPAAGVAATAAGIAIIAAATKYIGGMGTQGVEVPASATEGAGILSSTAGIYGQKSTSTGTSDSIGGIGGITGFTGAGAKISSTSIPKPLPPTLIEEVTAENAFKLIPAGSFDPGRFRQKDEPRTINITVNGAIDPISTARQINDILTKEASTSGAFNNLGASRFITT